MTDARAHATASELLGVYALDAVDADEARLIADHVHRCADCREELDGYRAVVAALAATEAAAPVSVWDAIVEQIDGAAPADGADQVGARDAHHSPTEPVPIRRPRRRRWLEWGSIAAAVAILAGATTVQTLRLERTTNQLAEARSDAASLALQQQRPPAAVAAALAGANPRSEAVTLSSDSEVGDAVIVLLPDGTGYLTQHRLQPLPPDRTYQLWAITDGRIVSAGVLGAEPGVVPFRVDPAGLEGFAITEETAGGVAVSDNPPVVSWLDA